MTKQCVDFYKEKLKIGDEVIPVLDEALLIGISGIVSKIEYNEEYDNYYITITDQKGDILLDGVDSRCYTTQARFDEREKGDFVYSLKFYDEKLFYNNYLPLTNHTDCEYEFPEDTTFIAITSDHLESIKECFSTYSGYDIFYFIDGSKVEVRNIKEYTYCMSDKYSYQIHDNFKIFKSTEELKKFIKELIKYFNQSDLTHINNQIIYSENEEGKEFEKQLICKFKQGI